MTALYRSTLEVARADLAAARTRERVAIELSSRLVRPLAHQDARLAFAAGLFATIVAMIVLPLTHVAPSATVVLAWAFPVAFAARFVTRLVAGYLWSSRVEEAAARNASAAADEAAPRTANEGADPFSALAELMGRPSFAEQLIAKLDARQPRATFYSLAGVCLLAPLTIHLVVYALMEMRNLWSWREPALHGFDTWIAMSAIFVGMRPAPPAGMKIRFGKNEALVAIQSGRKQEGRSSRGLRSWRAYHAQ